MKSRHLPFLPVLSLLLGFGAASLARGEIKYVLHISCDGLRGDLLQSLITTDPAGHPNWKKIVDEGATTFNARCDFDYSETIPNHCGIVTGRPVLNPAGQTTAAHSYTSNGYTGNSTTGDSIHQLGTATYVYKVSTFDMTHDRGLSTAIYGGKSRLNLFVHSYNGTKGRPDTVGIDNGRNKVDTALIADLSSATALPTVKNNVVAAISGGTLPNYSLIHFTDLDTGTATGGHSVGWGAAGWNQGVKNVDGYLGEIFTALNAAPPSIKGKVAMIITGDHGGGGGGSGPGSSPDRNHGDASSLLNIRTAVLLWGPGIPGGIDAHRLFRNRTDPGNTRPATTATTPQPLRNLDTANIAMLFLGIPPVEGSYFRPEPSATVKVVEQGGNFTLTWPSYLTGYTLQSTTNLATGPWVAESGTPTEVAGEFSLTIPQNSGEAVKFWRLVPPQ